MAKNFRDNFSKPIIDILAKRVGYLCSSPTCRKSTIGANENVNKATSIGIAAHITAASVGGPRYDTSYSKYKRQDISNGIWLCSNCAALIDKDPEKYTVEILHGWKKYAEEESARKLGGEFKYVDISQTKSPSPYNPILEVDLLGGGRSRSPRGMSNKNPIEMHDGQLVMVPGPKPIIYWALGWRYKLVIYNNSNFPAFNIAVESVGDVHFSEFEKLNDINNIAPLNNIELKVRFDDWIESEHTLADELLKPRFPEKFKGLKLKLTFYDQARNVHHSYAEFNEKGLINRKA